MNEVKVTTVIPPQVTPATSSEDKKISSQAPLPEMGGKDLPVDETKKPESTEPVQSQATKMEDVVEEVNQFVQSVQRDLHFSVDEDSGMTIIRVRDKESGELIRQIPEDIFLSMAQNLKDGQSLQLLDTRS